MSAPRASAVLLAALIAAAGCLTPHPDVVELTGKGPTAEELFTNRSQAINARTPTFDEKRQWEGQMEDRVFKYLREHPELEQTSRYMDFRFWWQVSSGSTPGEVRVLLDEPREKTADPGRMATLAERLWSELQPKAKEAWVYEPAWVLYFDDSGVVGMVHRVDSRAPRY